MPDLGGSSITVNNGSITIEDDPENSGKIRVIQMEATRNNIDPSTNITITSSTQTTNTITVSASLGAVITLKNVNIVSPTAPFLIATSAGAVTVDLDGTNILKATAVGCSGLQKTNDGRGANGMLTIQSTTGTGSLTATGYGYSNTNGSGIGGYNRDATHSAVGSYITITGGIITAIGSERNAGIRGDHITISGGYVTATGGSNGAGIGGGFWGNGSYITISGGTVIATGGGSAAGIGGGFAGNADNITISGGTVIATGGTYGIGGGSMSGGYGNKLTNFVITGGNIKSTFNAAPTNAVGGSNVYKTTFTVNGASDNTDVSGGLVIRDLSGKAYGMADVKTLDTDKVYAYLPSGDATAAYNLINYAANVSTGNNAAFVLAYTLNTPDPITLDGVTAAVNFGSVFPLKAGGLSVTANVSLSGTANKRGLYTINLQSPSVSISPTSSTKSVVIGDSLSDTLAFTFTMTTKDISDLVLNMTFVPTPIHTVTYTSSDATSGSLPVQAEVYEGDTYVVAGNGSLAKTGYTFSGWLNGGYAFSGTKTMGTSNVNLIAAWTANPYTVIFEPNGGSGSMANQSFTYNQSKLLSANNFTKTGYTFSGWAKTPGDVKVYADKESVSNIVESGTTTLYALWTPNNCTVSFNANSGNGIMSNQIFTTDKAQAIAANTFTKTGYTFSGWAKTPDGAVTYTNGQSVSNIAESGTTTFYAKWTANNYKVAFDANGGTGSMSDQSFTYDQSQPLSANTFTKTGYTFKGWSKTQKGEIAYSDKQNTSNISESGTITLYALWTESNFTVSFDANGGIGTMANQQFTYDVEQKLSQCAFTKPGYSFAGWALTSGGTATYNDLQIVKNLAVSGILNLYACWTVNSYSVSFQANGGIGTMPNQNFTYDVEQSLSANAFSRPNYIFMGWATDMMGTKVYDNAQSVKNLAESGTATLFAVWKEKTAAGINEAPQSYTYDGTPKAFSLAGANGTGFTVTYMQDGNTIANPTNAGKYDVKIERTEDATYAAYSKTINEGLVINKVGPSAFTVSTPKDTFTSFEITTKDLGVLTPSDFTITYGGTPVTATAISAYESGKYTITIPSQTADSEKVLSVKMNDTMANYSPYAVAVEVTPTVTLTDVSFSQPTLNIVRGTPQQLTLIFSPSNATNKTVTWTSGNTSIAAVSSNGLVTGVKQGSTTITAISADGNKTVTCIVTVYVPCTVSFDANGGTGSMPNQTFNYEAQAISANTFTRTGYTFSGWAKTPNGAVTYINCQSVSNISESETTTLYAKWTANNYIVAFDANGGTGSMTDQAFTYDQSQPLSSNTFTKTGYTFLGWAKTPTGVKAYSDKQNASNISESDTITLYALWTENNFAISFDANGGIGTMANQIFTYDKAQALAANTFTRTGYTFSGWAKTPDGAVTYINGQSVSNIAESGTTTLYAKWTANNYKVAFDANGGTGSMTDQTFTYDQSQPLSTNTFTKTGYTFLGWATDMTGAKVYDNAQSVKNLAQSGTATLFAVWQQKTAAGINETPQSYTYDGAPKEFSLAGANGTGFTVTYIQDGNTIANPTNAGKNDVEIKRAEDATYAAYNKTIYEGLVINKVGPSAFTVSTPKDTFTSFEITTMDLGALAPSDFSITFGGTPVTATAISVYQSGKYTITIPSQTADSEKILSVKMNDTMANYSPYAVAVTVTPTVTLNEVSFSQPTLSIVQGSAQQLTLIFSPSNATNKTVTWASGNSSIAAVSSSGLVTGVKQGTTTITAISADGNKTVTCVVTVYIPTPSPSYTSTPSPNNTPAPQTGLNAPITVDGKTENLGNLYTDGMKSTVLVDNASFEKRLKSSAEGSSCIISIAKNEIMTAQLVVKNVEEMAKKNMTLAIQSEGTTYNIRTDAVDTESLRSAFSGVETSNIAFEVTIKEASYAAAIAPSGTEIVGKPISFNITATYGGKSITVDSFSRFVERTVEITGEQANKITTAVVVEPNGTLRHVPTNVFQKDGKYYATINSLTNSIYALIQNEVRFNDAHGKWYEKTVNEMASRKIISGIGDGKFAGERSITRAEFAAILVRALGLPTSGASTFSDVPKGAWYSSAVATAEKYGFISGRGNNKFDPEANITRQEAMAMLQRASKLTDFIGKMGALSVFTDSSSVSTWASEASKWNIGSGLIVGSNEKLRPNDNISRAETATAILRLLQKAELVDVRS